MKLPSRNHPLGLAHRTRKNLEAIERARDAGSDVHEVTQLANSLLGLIVFPQDRGFIDKVGSIKLGDLDDNDWPEWHVMMHDIAPMGVSNKERGNRCKAPCDTLGDLVRHLRNASAHGRMSFSSDNRDMELVTLTVEDYFPDSNSAHWRASITGTDLRRFCYRLLDELESTTGDK